MKKWLKVATFVVFLLLAPLLAHSTQLGLRLFGGAATLSPTDINQGTKGWVDMHAGFFTRYAGVSLSGEANPIKMSLEGGADLLIYLSPRVALGIGAGYIQGKRDSELIIKGPTSESKMTSQPSVTATPIRLGLFFEIPGESLGLNINVGADYYFAKYTWDWEIHGEDLALSDSATAKGLGFHGGLGLEIMLSSNIAFLLEGTGRYAKIKPFEGTQEYREMATPETNDGTLYYLEGTDYPVLFIVSEKPTGYRVAREAEVDFSGFGVVAGLKLKF